MPHIHISEVHALQLRYDKLEAENQRQREIISNLVDENIRLRLEAWRVRAAVDRMVA